MNESSLANAHSLVLNETVYKTLASDKKRPLFIHEWLLYLNRTLGKTSKEQLKSDQAKILNQLIGLFNSFPGPPIRQLIAKNIATLFSLGDIIKLYETIEKCNELLKSKEHETQMNQMAKLCALNVIGALYERLGRMAAGSSFDDTIHVLLKYMKSADSLVRIEIVQTLEKILCGLGSAGQSVHKEIFKQLKPLVQDRVLAVRCASLKCLCEMMKHSTFLYSSPQLTNPHSSSSSSMSGNNLQISTHSPELDASINLGFKALDGQSNYDVRSCVANYSAQLIFFSINQLQTLLKSVMAASNAAANANINSNDTGQQQHQQQQQQQQQQQNVVAQNLINEKIKVTLNLLANGFNKPNSSSGFSLVRGAASSLTSPSSASNFTSSSISPASAQSSHKVSDGNMPPSTPASAASSHVDLATNTTRQSPSTANNQTASQANIEVRIGVTYAYVELANLLGTQWLERNLKLFLTHLLNLVNNTKSVSSHLDAVHSRKCVQFVLRSIIGGMLNEKMQIQAALELVNVIDKCINGVDIVNEERAGANQHHVLICALYELSCIIKCLNTSASVLVSDDSLKMIDKVILTLLYPNNAVKCVAAWCLRTIACSLPALMSSLLDNCLDKLSLIRNPSDALLGYGYACAALLGGVNQCHLGIPHLKSKLAFNIGEELLRTASQSNNISLAKQKNSIGWLLLGSFMTLGSTIVRKQVPRLKRLWTSAMPLSLEQLESEKKRGDTFTWQLSLESRAGALATMHSFLTHCGDLLNEDRTLINSLIGAVEGALVLLAQLPSIIKQNNNSVNLKAQAAMYRLKLYQTLIALPSADLYESSFAIILRELVAEFTLADQQTSNNLVTSTLRSVCHSNDSILFANCWLQDDDFKVIEDQLQPYSASGCETLEHDVTFLYQSAKTNPARSAPLFGSLFNQHVASMSTNCACALPLGVAVIDASIQLFGMMYPKIPNKHRLQMLLHFSECIQKMPINKSNAANKQALQINIFTAVLGSLKALAETKSELGDEAIREATLKLVMETLCHTNPILRCAAGEALGRMAQVIAESHFVVKVAQFCFEKLRNSQDVTSRTGYALGLGCLHRYLGTMGAGQHMTSSVSILFGMAQNSNSSMVQVWAIHALYLIIDSGGSMFRNYVDTCVEFIVQSVLSIPHTNRDVFVGLGKLLNSLITFMGPEIEANASTISSCLITCTVMQMHTDAMIKAEAIQCLQELNLFAPKCVNLNDLVPYLVNALVSKEFLMRKVAIACLRQVCQKNSLEVCQIASSYVKESKPSGLLALIGERGLECLLFKILDIETNPQLIRNLHDILNSLLCSMFNESSLKRWLFLCKEISIGAEQSQHAQDISSQPNSRAQRKERSTIDDEEEDDDSQTLHATQPDLFATSNTNLSFKQITKNVSPKWPNRVFAIELIRRIINMCRSLKQNQAHFDLGLAKKLTKPNEDYLILFLQDLMQIACISAVNPCDPLKLAGLDLLYDLITEFGKVEEPNPEFKGHLILEQYQAQVSAGLRPQFSIETSAHVTAKACQVCSIWISSGVARDLNDLRRIHQLLVSSLQKLTSTTSPDHLIYSELSLTIEKLAVLRAWAEVYIVAQQNKNSGLLSLVKPELDILSYHWSMALKDYAFLCLPSEYASQLPIEGGSFYHADLVDSSKPIYKEHFTKILLAYSVWLEQSQFDIDEIPPNQHKLGEENNLSTEENSEECAAERENRLNERKEKLFFMLLGLALETLSNTTGLTQLSDETVENILEAIETLLRTDLARTILTHKSTNLCVEILSILYKVKLTRDLMSINMSVMRVVLRISQFRLAQSDDSERHEVSAFNQPLDDRNDQSRQDEKERRDKKCAMNLLFVILEICVRDLIKYVPNLLDSPASNQTTNSSTSFSSLPPATKTFIHLHVTQCKVFSSEDVQLIHLVLKALCQLVFHAQIPIDKRISMVSIVFHIHFSLLESMSVLLATSSETDTASQLEGELFKRIGESFRILCSTSSPTCKWHAHFSTPEQQSNDRLAQVQQSALLSTLNLKRLDTCKIMKLLALFFQCCSIKVFEPLNVYEKCKVFMCSMRCSDDTNELLCMIESLNEILQNEQTSKELRVILLREHLTYLLKMTSLSSNGELTQSKNGIGLVKALLDLIESMITLMSDEEDPSKQMDTLTIYIHMLSVYLSEERKMFELNDIVLKKLLNLATNHKAEFKQVLDQHPSLKAKIGNAFKSNSASSVQHSHANSNQQQLQQQQASKAPKIQLKNFNLNQK